MSIASAELAAATTEQIIAEMQQDLLHVAQRADECTTFDHNPWDASFYAGDNSTVRIEKSPEGVIIRVNSLPESMLKEADDAMGITTYYEYDNQQELVPISPKDERSMRAIIKGSLQYRPKFWPDGGISLKSESDDSNLAHDHVLRAARLVTQVAGARLIPTKSRHA